MVIQEIYIAHTLRELDFVCGRWTSLPSGCVLSCPVHIFVILVLSSMSRFSFHLRIPYLKKSPKTTPKHNVFKINPRLLGKELKDLSDNNSYFSSFLPPPLFMKACCFFSINSVLCTSPNTLLNLTIIL